MPLVAVAGPLGGRLSAVGGPAPLLLVLEHDEHVALGDGRGRPLDLGVHVLYFGHATLAEGARVRTPSLLL